MIRRKRLLPLALGLLAFTGTAALGFAPHEDLVALERPLAIDRLAPEASFVPAAGLARSTTLGAGWRVQPNERTGTAHIAYGGNVVLASGVNGEEQAVELARAFLLDHAPETLARSDNLELANAVNATGKWAVHFRQLVDGVAVHRGTAFVVIGESGRVMAFGSDFVPEASGLSGRPALTERQAIALASDDLSTSPSDEFVPRAELAWAPVPTGNTLELRLAWKTFFSSVEPFGEWESWVDANTGEVFARTNRIDLVNVIGAVEGDVQDFGYCDGESTDGLENLTVVVTGVGNDVTDDDGDFEVTNGGTGLVQVSAQLLGPFINVNRYSGLGSDASWLGQATPGTPFTIAFTDGNARQDERDCFYHANRAHDFVTAIQPSFTGLDFPMVTIVGRTDGFCPGNAWWSSGSSTINFCEAGGGFANTGEIGNVVYHEYGHGVNDYVYAANGGNIPSGDMHEGNADVIANFIDRNPIIGIGFSTCSGGIRDADNSLQWPQDNNGGHFGGQIIAGFYWDAWQSLLAVKPQAEADDIAWSAWHFSRVLGTPTNQPDQVFWTFVADDDDADLMNGTPNHEHWCLGATNHGFDCPEITSGVFITHEKLTNTEDGTQGFDVAAVIVSTEGGLNPTELKLFWQLNGGGFSEIQMTPTVNPDEYSAHIPALGQFSEVDYYVTAEDVIGNIATDPEDAPSFVHAFDVAFDVEDFEGGAATWTAGIGSDTAAEGIWELIDPIGTEAQPGEDATPGAGTLAFVTGQCGAGNGSCGPCTQQCNDVDFGVTTLLSPVYDLSGASQAKVKYDRWYSNDTWLSPGFDFWVVDVSNDGGTSWTNVENTNASDRSWQAMEIDVNAIFGSPNQVRVRFRASDTGNDSVVEAGVDEFRILADLGAVGVEDLAQAEPLVFSLSQNQPNPFRPATRIDFAVPSESMVDLSVFDVAGRKVRRLDAGTRTAGRYQVQWDGRDSAGSRVAAGVYFYRLEANGEVLTKKMTVLQ